MTAAQEPTGCPPVGSLVPSSTTSGTKEGEAAPVIGGGRFFARGPPTRFCPGKGTNRADNNLNPRGGTQDET